MLSLVPPIGGDLGLACRDNPRTLAQRGPVSVGCSRPTFPRTIVLSPYDLGRSNNTVTPMLMYVLRKSGV